jgi:protein arginine kinase activator
MNCQVCQKRPATLHLTKIIGSHKEELHLCEVCAREREEFKVMMNPSLALPHLLAGLVSGTAPFIGPPPRVQELRCPHCGLPFSQFAATGRLGCPRCYEAFRGEITPVLQRVQAGLKHTGKAPLRRAGSLRRQREVDRLREELSRAIAEERYEQAAVLRDRIRQLERELGAR